MGKPILLFLDGSWGQFRRVPAKGNLVRLKQMVMLADGVVPTHNPAIYYDDGNAAAWHWKSWTGLGALQQVERAYDYLVTHFERGDQLYCFGASRGAWAARNLCGFIDRVGLLPMSRREQRRQAYQLYRAEQRRPLSVDERKTYESCYRCNAMPEIRMLGLWDTLGANGIPVPGLTQLSSRLGWCLGRQSAVPVVHAARQVLAIDEQRSFYPPSPWLTQGSEMGQHPEVEQLWFTGSHADVCGYGDPYLGDRSLLWMAEEASQAGTPLREEALQGLRFRITREEQHSDAQALKQGHSPQVTREFGLFHRLFERFGWDAEPRTIGYRQRAEQGMEPILGELVHPSVDRVIGIKGGFYRPRNLLNALATGQVRFAAGYEPQYCTQYYPESERRSGERESCLELAELSIGGNSIECLVLDRSESGLGISCKMALQQGEVIDLTESRDPRKARIMWVHEERAGIAFAA
ncbi:DUF2235 domain-containing protein [Aestuariirhabdus sp. Z084]|uniref:phospholipase effector Tle1 domain-containing protein n=1 Tax=Aestuariirhabdus haliotis TaxID=2918751 RepID=UPI00201B3BFE|nr:DUF2235 domain-containing protein [Aestuariirhabdus haliotis]MCL6414367.1 DUF2235 domain-containing protein [Aestuariirhabdus haliotis]MCL6418299.1 DUF2235 domain-containing protein [Aestuariirhabdus haliotis]